MSDTKVQSKHFRINKETILTISGHVIKIASLIPACQSVAKLAEEILTLVDDAIRNQEILKLLAERVEASSLWLLEQKPEEKKCKLAFERYIKVLKEIKKYVKELRKPGKFSARFRNKVVEFFTAREKRNLYTIYNDKLDEAINGFILALSCDSNVLLHNYKKYLSAIFESNNKMFSKQSRQLTEIQETIVLIRKGIEMPESELEKVRLSPEWIRNEDDEEPETRGKNKHIKRHLYGSQEVAVKKIKIPEGENENRKLIEKYVFLMSKLSHCDSIEKFYGTLTINHDHYIVTGWAEKGNLEDFLRSDQELSWPCRLKIAEQIANALEFIHHADIYHHDVKSKNVLLDKSMDAKLSGFDYSRLKDHSTTSNEEQMQSLRWTAPEKLKRKSYPEPYKKTCDIYGLSITLWEIGTRKMPYEEIEVDVDVADYVINDGRPKPFPTGGPVEYNDLIKQSWSARAGARPSIEVIREDLHKMTKRYQEYYDNPSTASLLQNIDSSNFESSNFDSSMSQPNSQLECNESLQDQSLPPFEDVVKLHKQKKHTSAFSLFQQYAALSHTKSPIAKFYCGYYLYHGKFGINKDEDSAIEYLRQAADAKITKAQALYAEVCLEGRDYDPINGIKYLKKAVEHGDRSALERWAEILYDGGHNLDINMKEASIIRKKAVSKGSKLILSEENQENQDKGHLRNFLIISAPVILMLFLIIFHD
ncbi:hypothetical protein RclHR1_00670016 [Rhizophagus clarus]|uniref:Kinase-like domain-containing protein n=1 Tax=Rhizophagus clarus TaxID=94130 RepID=A0A2Z6RTX8_9GLOM|nr:hypothetical protein RclHR1_00670016 [Rhizophagus clarus]GET00370.1 kinase-like domain-containing protein [Rhizophagus clarus]